MAPKSPCWHFDLNIFRAGCPIFNPILKNYRWNLLVNLPPSKPFRQPSPSPYIPPTSLPLNSPKSPTFPLKFPQPTALIILIFEMHRQQKLGNFISKLQYLLSRQEYSEIICWDKTETTIEVLSEQRMETEIIPLYFRHQKFQSFVRQLNLYGFRKVKANGRHRFTHPLLLQGEKLQAITSHKLSGSKKDSKQEGKDSPSCEKSQPCRAGEAKQEKNLHPTLNSITQFQKSANTPAGISLETAASIQNIPQELPQLLITYPQPYLNYWNLMFIHPGNQFTPVFFVNPLPSSQ